MRIIFAGTPEVAVPTLRSLAAPGSGHEVVGVITREDAPIGRKQVLTPSPVALAARDLDIPVLKANRLDDAATEWARARRPDLGVVVAYGGLIREPLLSLPALGWINLHFSDLPRWRGAAPVQRALMAGEQRLGVSVFRLVETLDAGDVLTRDARTFAPGTSAGAALAELADHGTAAVARAIEALDADPGAGEAQAGDTTYAYKLSREDGRLDTTAPAGAVLARWAGTTPEPGAWTKCDGQTLKLLELRPAAAETEVGTAPGTAELVRGRAILHLADGALELVRVQPAGKGGMDGAAWLRGRGGKAELA